MSLLEAAVAAALVALLGVAVLGAAAQAIHVARGDPIRDALRERARDELRVALDVLKYQGAVLVPRSVTTALPLPSATSFPARIALSVATGSLGTSIAITASALNSNERIELDGLLSARAPLPGSSLQAPGLVPAPTGAP